MRAPSDSTLPPPEPEPEPADSDLREVSVAAITDVANGLVWLRVIGGVQHPDPGSCAVPIPDSACERVVASIIEARDRGRAARAAAAGRKEAS